MSSSQSAPRLIHLTTSDMSLDWLLGPQLRAFGDAGYEVVGMSAPGPHLQRLAEMGVRHVAVPAFTRASNPLQDLRAFAQLVTLLRRERPQILHTHNPKPGILGRIAGRLAGVPRVINTQHGLYAQPTDRLRRRLPVYAAERIAAAFSHLELVQNPEDVTTLVDVLKVPRHKVRWLGNGIDLARFDPTSVRDQVREEIRAEWGIGPDDLVVGVVGRLVAEKGIVEILEAARHLGGSHPNLRFVIVGPADPERPDAVSAEMMADAESVGVVFAGRRTDMPECYRAMDIFLTASWREGFPRAAMEAAAMGLPTVATDIRGNRQVVGHRHTGILVPVRDPQALAAAVSELATDAVGRQSMGSAARKRAVEEFDQQLVIDKTLAAYRG